MERLRRLLRIKKAQAGDEILRLIPRLILITFIGFAFIFMINNFLNREIDSFPVESDVFIQRALYSEYGFCYVDPSAGKPIPGMIDYDKIQETGFVEELEKHLYYPYPISANFSVHSPSLGYYDVIYHKDDYDYAGVFFRAKTLKRSGINHIIKYFPVLVHSKASGIEQGELTVEMALPESFKRK